MYENLAFFRMRLEKYENLANSKKETEKVWRPGMKRF